jgi:hypothetical protein
MVRINNSCVGVYRYVGFFTPFFYKYNIYFYRIGDRKSIHTPTPIHKFWQKDYEGKSELCWKMAFYFFFVNLSLNTRNLRGALMPIRIWKELAKFVIISFILESYL